MEQVIADVKTISLGNRKFYKPGMDGMKAVDLRAAELGGEYRRGALKVDRELGYQDGNGPTLRKLQSTRQSWTSALGHMGRRLRGSRGC